MAQANRPSCVTAPPTGKLPTGTVLPCGWSTRPLGRLRVPWPALSSPPAIATTATPRRARQARARTRATCRARIVADPSADDGDVEGAVVAELHPGVVGVIDRPGAVRAPGAAASARRGGGRGSGRGLPVLGDEERLPRHAGA